MNEYEQHALRKAKREAARAAISRALPLEDKIAKLPKWAREHIDMLTEKARCAHNYK